MSSTEADEAEPRLVLRRWVAAKQSDPDAGESLDGARLFEQRMLDSLDLVELITLIERLRGEAVDVETLTADDVGSIDAIVGRFFASGNGR